MDDVTVLLLGFLGLIWLIVVSKTFRKAFAIFAAIIAAIIVLAYASGARAADFTARDLLPNYIAPEFVHQSHAVQHFGPDQSNYGSEAIALNAHWDLSKHFYLELSEAISLDRRQTYSGWANGDRTMYGYGEMLGPREEFTGRVGYRFQIH